MASKKLVFYLYALLAAAFLADVNLPSDVAGGICYVFPLLFCLRYCEIKHFVWAVILSITGILFDLVDTTILNGWSATPPLNAAVALIAMLVSSWFVKQLNNTRLSEALAHETMQSLLQGIINNAPALIAVKDRQGRYTMINQGLRDEWGPAAESLLGRTGPEVSPDKVFSKKMHEQDMRLMQDEENNTALEKFPHKPNKHLLHDSLSFI